MPAISNQPTPMKKGLILSIVVGFILLGIGGVVVLPVGLLALGFRFESKPSRAALTLPDGVHAIEHSRVRLPTICAEYSRNVTYITGGVRGKTTPLKIDTCGGYPVNCYLIETAQGPFLRLDDAVAEHLLDLTTQTTYAMTRVGGEVYIAELRDERASFGWSMWNYDRSTLSVTLDGIQARSMTELTGDAPDVYLGRFDGGTGHLRFTPASESPEVAIRHLIDRVQRANPILPDAQPGLGQHP